MHINIGSSQNNAWFQPLIVMAATFVVLKTSDSDLVENAHDRFEYIRDSLRISGTAFLVGDLPFRGYFVSYRVIDRN